MGPHLIRIRSPREQLKLVNEGRLSIVALDFEHYGGGPLYYHQHKACALRKEALHAPAKFCVLKRRKR